MNGAELYPGSSRSLASLRQMRLMALLRDMIDDGGKVKAAKALGVNYRTVSKAVGSGTLTDRLADALERHLLLGGGSAAAQQQDRVDALVERVDVMEKELRGGLEAVVGEVKAFREEPLRSARSYIRPSEAEALSRLQADVLHRSPGRSQDPPDEPLPDCLPGRDTKHGLPHRKSLPSSTPGAIDEQGRIPRLRRVECPSSRLRLGGHEQPVL